MKNLPSIFGSMVFNDSVMQEMLPANVYKTLKKTIKNNQPLDITIANVVANAMKEWAIGKGATHYTHWFHPMTGITAEKHESFISPTSEGKVIMEFSGKELIKGEPDASSFPSGGIRATFEARGYTAWDPTSYAFIKDGLLCIPTAFCSYSGDVLDKKTPLLRSMDALNKHALRILKLFGNSDVTRVMPHVGAEQEYFLITKEHFKKRKDLKFCGRTLFGARPPKGQEMNDHYFGTLKTRVLAYMNELDEELWKLGIPAKTEHNEVAPSQHELAPLHETANVACDHNQLMMDIMKKVANRHGLECLLHEKPFEGINGSGKHNNWSLMTDTGANLLDPGNSPHENAQFLLFLTAIIKAVDEYQDLLRISVASAGNDCRLGGNEAPPAIISIYLGDELMEIVSSLMNGNSYSRKNSEELRIGTDILPCIPRDNSDRNRTSPFAFTGNKFEFRMVGSSFSIAGPNIVINTIVADALDQFATKLEMAENFEEALKDLIKKNLKKHRRILLNGNNYCEEWVTEAERRGLLNLKTAIDALPYYVSEKNIALFTRHRIFNEREIRSRCEILVENYCKTIKIEALTMLDMARKDILPAVESYIKELARTANSKKALSPAISCEVEIGLIERLSALVKKLYEGTEKLDAQVARANGSANMTELGQYCRDEIFKTMGEVRAAADELEALTGSKYWPFPTYSEILFSV